MTIHSKLNTGASFNLHNSQSGCCPDDGTVCRYQYTADDEATLTSIVVDGNVVALGGLVTTGSLSDVITSIETILKAAGYTTDQFPSITAWRNDTSLIFDFYSSVVFGDLITSAGTLTVDINCVATPFCYYEVEVEVTATLDVYLEFGDPTELAGGNIAGDYDTGGEDTLRDDIITLFDGDDYQGTLLNVLRVEATEDFVRNVYVVGIWMHKPNGGELYYEGEIINPKHCSPNYSSAV